MSVKKLNKQLIFSTFVGLFLCAQSVFAAPSEDRFIKVDGSSTVYPITEAVAEEFGKVEKSARVTVGVSGTGGGFKKFCSGETDISNASRPIKKEEIVLCQQNGIEYVELPVAYDALTVVVNPQNSWVDHLTVAELKMIWEPEAQEKITHWNQVRADWPNEELVLFGAGVDSGTYDYFTEAITGKAHSSRGDFTSSEDDNVLVQGVSANKNSLGFFGLAYYVENKTKLKAVPIDDRNESNGTGPQMPSVENVVSGVYQPLARPMFVYVSKKSLDNPLVKKFITFYIENSSELADEVGYVRLPDNILELAKKRLDKEIVGSIYSGGPQTGVNIADLMLK